ncbi:hypothetical protein, partial [Burkholderia cenocepacia]|uniref:hypothetical protein n=1 Tax=Burkholderia cenocepacia TaxID=95486 RepID=UPI0038CC0B87
ALKAAAETWLASVGHALRSTPASTHVIRVKALVSAADREAEPDRTFDGYSDVDDVATKIVGLVG